MDNEQLIALLKDTRRQLEVRGRCRLLLINGEGKVCLDGAVALACGIRIDREGMGVIGLEESPSAQAVLGALAAQIPPEDRIDDAYYLRTPSPRVAVYLFNDDDETTDEDCFNLIDKALAEAGGLA